MSVIGSLGELIKWSLGIFIGILIIGIIFNLIGPDLICNINELIINLNQ